MHLARLADGYPACRECGHRDDVEGLSDRSKGQIPPARHPKRPADFLGDEGVVGELHDGLDPVLAGRFAAAFGIILRDELGSSDCYPSVAIAGDGRAVTQSHFAAAVERVRWVGCDVVDLGTVPCPALPWAIAELGADGGLYVGNPLGDAHGAGIRFYGRDGRPLTGEPVLAAIGDGLEIESPRPVRSSGKASKADLLVRYESRFADSFHGLRPLRFLLHTTCRPVGRTVERLLQETACKMVLNGSEAEMLPERLSESVGHFAVAIEQDGLRSRVWDERGEPVAFERLFLLVAQIVSAHEPSDRVVVVDEELPATVASVLEQSGLTVQRCGPLPSQVHAAMVSSGAALGADGAERIWYGEPGGRVIADGLGTLTLLLGKHSESDRPLSELLDSHATGH